MGAILMGLLGGLSADALKDAAEEAINLALDPSLNEALSPSAGLSVTPLVFNSIDPEGHWKRKDWGYNEPREFTNLFLKDTEGTSGGTSGTSGGTSKPNPGESPIPFRGQSPGTTTNSGSLSSATNYETGNLLTINISKPDKVGDLANAAASSLLGPIGRAAYELAKQTILKEATAEISATWEHDPLEIWGGFAGLQRASGFLSTFGHRANVQIVGTPYGNFLPGAYMIVMTGYVNPVGPKFIEFRCAAVIRADKRQIQPLWGFQWNRDGDRPKPVTWDTSSGYQLYDKNF